MMTGGGAENKKVPRRSAVTEGVRSPAPQLFYSRVRSLSSSMSPRTARLKKRKLGQAHSTPLTGLKTDSPMQSPKTSGKFFPRKSTITPPQQVRTKLSHFNPQDLAEQLCVMDSELLRKIQPYELEGGAWMKEEKAELSPNVLAMIKSSNRIAMLVPSEILAETTPQARAKVISIFIKVASKCYNMHNFNSLKAILAGLQSTPVFRLTKSWKEVPTKKRKKYSLLTTLMSEERNWTRYREELQTTLDDHIPCIPFLGVLLTTIVQHGSAVSVKKGGRRISGVEGYTIMEAITVRNRLEKMRKISGNRFSMFSEDQISPIKRPPRRNFSAPTDETVTLETCQFARDLCLLKNVEEEGEGEGREEEEDEGELADQEEDGMEERFRKRSNALLPDYVVPRLCSTMPPLSKQHMGENTSQQLLSPPPSPRQQQQRSPAHRDQDPPSREATPSPLHQCPVGDLFVTQFPRRTLSPLSPRHPMQTTPPFPSPCQHTSPMFSPLPDLRQRLTLSEVNLQMCGLSSGDEEGLRSADEAEHSPQELNLPNLDYSEASTVTLNPVYIQYSPLVLSSNSGASAEEEEGCGHGEGEGGRGLAYTRSRAHRHTLPSLEVFRKGNIVGDDNSNSNNNNNNSCGGRCAKGSPLAVQNEGPVANAAKHSVTRPQNSHNNRVASDGKDIDQCERCRELDEERSRVFDLVRGRRNSDGARRRKESNIFIVELNEGFSRDSSLSLADTTTAATAATKAMDVVATKSSRRVRKISRESQFSQSSKKSLSEDESSPTKSSSRVRKISRESQYSKKSPCTSEEESSPIRRREVSPGSSDGGKSTLRLRSATTITTATPTTTTLSSPQDSGTSPSTDSSSSTRGVLASVGSPLTDESDARSGLPMEGAEAVLPSVMVDASSSCEGHKVTSSTFDVYWSASPTPCSLVPSSTACSPSPTLATGGGGGGGEAGGEEKREMEGELGRGGSSRNRRAVTPDSCTTSHLRPPLTHGLSLSMECLSDALNNPHSTHSSRASLRELGRSNSAQEGLTSKQRASILSISSDEGGCGGLAGHIITSDDTTTEGDLTSSNTTTPDPLLQLPAQRARGGAGRSPASRLDNDGEEDEDEEKKSEVPPRAAAATATSGRESRMSSEDDSVMVVEPQWRRCRRRASKVLSHAMATSDKSGMHVPSLLTRYQVCSLVCCSELATVAPLREVIETACVNTEGQNYKLSYEREPQ